MFFLMIAILIGMRFLFVVLICVSLMISDIVLSDYLLFDSL